MATWFEQFGNWNTKATAGLMGGGFGKGLGSLGINSSNIGGIANTIGQIGTGLLAGQNETGIGNAMQTIGGLASNIPGVGGLIGAGVGVLGGLVNAAFGSNINDEFVAQTENQANQLGNRIFGANTNGDLLNDWQNMVMQSNVSKSEVGSDGWFSSKASDKTRELNRQIDEANARQLANFNIAAQNVDAQNDLRILQNMAAYGGPINSFRKYYDKGGYLSQAKALIRQNEGWREKPYNDAPKGKQWRSVGYGFNDSGFREKYPEGISKHYEHGITKKQAEEELDYFLSKAEKQLKSIYGKQWNDFTDSQKAAILDTYYQRPASVGKGSRFYKAVTAGEDAGKYLGVAGFSKRNKIRQGVFGGSQDYVNLGVETENPSANSSSLQEVTPFTPVVHNLDLSGITPTQAKALELNLASPTFDLSMFGSTPTQQESYVPTVGTIEDFLASYGDFEEELFKNGGKLNGNNYDDGGLFGNETVDTMASFLPILGTAEDAYQFYKNPSWENAGWLALSLGSDIFTGGMASRAIKAARLASKAEDAARVATKAAGKNWNAQKVLNATGRNGANVHRSIEAVKAAGDVHRAEKARAADALFNATVSSGVDQGLNSFLNATQMDMLPNMAKAFGGKLNNNNMNIFDFGGGLTHGMDLDTGINWVNEGGSHGENPLGGVPMGVDEQGIPNLVEEGEAIWNGDYVFSKRMKVPKKLREKYSLPDNATFADAVAKLTKSSDERPLSPIDRNTQDYILGEFADTQEEIRMAKAQRAMDRQQQLQDDFLMGMQFGLGGHMSPMGIVPDSDNVSLFDKLENSFADGGGIHIDPSKKGTFKAQASKMGMGVQEAASHILANKENYSPAMVKKANFAKVFAHADGGDLFSNPFAYGGELGNIFEGTGNKPNSLSIPSTPKDPLRMLWEKIGGAKYTDMANAAVDKFMEDNLYSHIDDIMGSIAKMPEPQLDKFFSTPVGQHVASFIANSESTGNNVQQAGVQRWMKATGRLTRPIQRTVVNAAKRAMAQSRQVAKGQMKTPKGGGKPTTVTGTKSPVQVARESMPAVRAQRDARFPAVKGPSEVAPTSSKALATRGTTEVTPFAPRETGVTRFTGNDKRWAWEPLAGLGAIGAGGLLDWALSPDESEVDAMTGAAKVQRTNNTQGGTTGTETDAETTPVASNKGKINGQGVSSSQKAGSVNEKPIATGAMTDEEFAAEYPMIARPGDKVAPTNWTDGSIWGNTGTTKATQEEPIIVNGKFKPKPTWMRQVPIWMSGLMGLKEMLTPADYGNADAITRAAYQAGTPISVGTEYIGDYRKRDPFDERYLMNIINQRGAAANRNFMNLSGGNRAVAMSGILANDLTTQMSLAEAARQAYLANRADDADVAAFNKDTNKFNATAQNTRNLSLAQLNSGRQSAMLSGIAQGARLRQAIKDQRDAAISANLTNFAQNIGELGRENGFYNMLGGLNDEGILKYFYGDNYTTKFNV